MNNLRMPSPAIFVAVLALVAAIASTALAGTDATTSASVKKQVKQLKKRVTALEQTDQVPGPQGEQGVEGVQGPPGEDATNLFAYIHDGGDDALASVQYGSGVTGVSDAFGDNPYTVTFNRSLENCVVHAVPGFGSPSASAGGVHESYPLMDINGADVQVTFFIQFGADTDTSFMITAFC